MKSVGTGKKRTMALALSAALAGGYCLIQDLPASAQLKGSASRTSANSQATYWQKHPKVKSATVGAGVGVATGAITGLVSKKGVVRGAAIGAGTGAGVGLLQSSETMKRHPIAKKVAQGTLVGADVGLAAKKGRGTGKTTAKVAATGAAVGLAAGLLKDLR